MSINHHYPYDPGYRDTDTSKAAAVDAKEFASRMKQFVLGVLVAHPDGLTTREIAKITGIDYDTIQPRTSELRQAGLIEDSGVRRYESKFVNGKPKAVIVWRLKSATTEHGTSDLVEKVKVASMASSLEALASARRYGTAVHVTGGKWVFIPYTGDV